MFFIINSLIWSAPDSAHVLDDVVDLVHGNAGQAEVADLHVRGVREIVLVAKALDIDPTRMP